MALLLSQGQGPPQQNSPTLDTPGLVAACGGTSDLPPLRMILQGGEMSKQRNVLLQNRRQAMLCPSCGRENGGGKFGDLCPACEIWIATRRQPDPPKAEEAGGPTRVILNFVAHSTQWLRQTRQFFDGLHL